MTDKTEIGRLYKNIADRRDVRENLIELKELLRIDMTEKHEVLAVTAANALKELAKDDYSMFLKLLSDEDAKVRKNAALIAGYLKAECFLKPLIEAYKNEEQLFVRPSYLYAIGEYDYKSELSFFKSELSRIKSGEISAEEEKHRKEEIKLLYELIRKAEGVRLHEFTGFNEPSQIVLLTNRNFKEATLLRVKPYAQNVREFGAGVTAKTESLINILPIRTYEELLFAVDDLKSCSKDPVKAAEEIINSSFISFLKKMHKITDESMPFYFRIELKSDAEQREKTVYVRKMAAELERLSKRFILNSTGEYEVELRLIMSKTGEYKVLIKLYTLKDMRFFYRRESMAYDIKPVNAALAMELAAPWLVEGGQVLDPYCGSGIMLVERKRRLPSGTMYGLDIHKEALDKAHLNFQLARIMVNLINRDFFEFKHEYLFDEIVTNMPFEKNSKTADIDLIYHRFFASASRHLKPDGIMVVYSHNRELIKKYCKGAYKIEKEFEISLKEEAYLYIIRFGGQQI